ncbi:MAG TPA: type II toxin-antitoxin system VapC family toxin [Verrucomicrobiae bacterium]|nr:type II toxin-antitoxin system VapC family toxin [Verrucomicrobiae bacterium]
MRTFLDSGVLLSAWKRGELHDVAVAILEDDSRKFVTCENVQLELLPKPTYEKRQLEVEFYNEHFATVSGCEPFSEALGKSAMKLAKKHGLAAGDALNLAAAIRQSADEFVTSELPGKPIFRVHQIKITSLYSLLSIS